MHLHPRVQRMSDSANERVVVVGGGGDEERKRRKKETMDRPEGENESTVVLTHYKKKNFVSKILFICKCIKN